MPRHIGSTDGEFSVCVFFVSEEQEYVRGWVSVEEAVEAFRHYTSPTIPAQRLGFIKQVLITDGCDCTAMEWKYGEGLVFPTKEMIDAEMEKSCLDAGMLEHEPADWERNRLQAQANEDYEKGPVSDEEFWS